MRWRYIAPFITRVIYSPRGTVTDRTRLRQNALYSALQPTPPGNNGEQFRDWRHLTRASRDAEHNRLRVRLGIRTAGEMFTLRASVTALELHAR